MLKKANERPDARGAGRMSNAPGREQSGIVPIFRTIIARPYLFLEFLIVCLGIPTYIIVTASAPLMFSFLWAATVYGWMVLRFDQSQSLGDIWRWSEVNWRNLKTILLRWILSCAVLAAFTLWYAPERFLSLPRHSPEFIPGFLLFYSVFSALPQEFLFCVFFFRRYRPYFGDGRWMVVASALIFTYAHMLYLNPIAPTFSFFGGIIFALTYLKTRSLVLVTLEHSLYGMALFVVGLGRYFYSGAVG